MANYKDLHDEDGVLSMARFRKMVLASIRKNLRKFKKDYGPTVVIACDTYGSWRKDYFPYYKANRKAGREESTLDWKWIFESITMIKEELKEYFPYRVIEVPLAEADDVIGTLAHRFGAVMGDGQEKMMIVSGDKDFIQLQKFSNVYQYSPVLKKDIKSNNPEAHLVEHIIRGDGGDGIPNVLSADDILVTPGARQTVLTAKRFETLKEEITKGTHVSTGYSRNKMLIDLSNTPERLRINILESYEAQASKTRLKLMNYFIKFRLSDQLESLQDF
jgi:hypothetical protein